MEFTSVRFAGNLCWPVTQECTVSKRCSLYINLIPQVVSVHVICIVGTLSPGGIPK